MSSIFPQLLFVVPPPPLFFPPLPLPHVSQQGVQQRCGSQAAFLSSPFDAFRWNKPEHPESTIPASCQRSFALALPTFHSLPFFLFSALPCALPSLSARSPGKIGKLYVHTHTLSHMQTHTARDERGLSCHTPHDYNFLMWFRRKKKELYTCMHTHV